MFDNCSEVKALNGNTWTRRAVMMGRSVNYNVLSPTLTYQQEKRVWEKEFFGSTLLNYSYANLPLICIYLFVYIFFAPSKHKYVKIASIKLRPNIYNRPCGFLDYLNRSVLHRCHINTKHSQYLLLGHLNYSIITTFESNLSHFRLYSRCAHPNWRYGTWLSSST